MKNKDKKKYGDCEWDCKLGLFIMVFFPITIVYTYTKHSKYYQMAKKKKEFFNPEYYFYFRFIVVASVMMGIIMSALIVKMLKFFIK